MMMKYLLLFIVLGLVFFMLGARQRGGGEAQARRDTPPPPPAPPRPKAIVSCAQCGLHLPQDEALPGRGGVFCGAAHRAAYEAAHGGSSSS
ncbi:PP0621 family protein [Pelomonas sp. KK5]|uniref:PP0621 family protein n=1 Tax=Pelomonas sp. KK5 TaxID=1855730 RepID=UPI001E3BB5D2|nr:PP0621 family protein [Pelomonas sp. KK5]